MDYRIALKDKDMSDAELKNKTALELKRMNAEICNTLDKIHSLKEKLNEKIKLKYVDSTYILNSIIIVGDKTVVVDYLHQRGSGSPIFVLKGNPVCESYQREFDRMWEIGREGA